jgi:uncharacterized protein YjiS (DUF1127 family)
MFDTFKSRYNKWNLYKRTVRELQGLTNRELADLGISRSDIHSIAREAVQGA